jgi:hypothetical protein
MVMVEAVEPFNLHPRTLYIYKVFEALLLWWMGICMYTYTYTVTTTISVATTGGRAITAGSRFQTMGDRFGKDYLVGGEVKSFTQDCMDISPLHYLMEEPTATACVGVLLDQDDSMKWRRQKKRASLSYIFIFSSRCQCSS